jgi:hypothetical protein
MDYVLVITGVQSLKNQEILKVVKRFAQETRVRSQETEGEYWEIILEVQLKGFEEDAVAELHKQLNGIQGISKVSLLAPQIALPV